MSCRPIIRDLRSRDHGLCRTCLLRLASQPTVRPWISSPFSSRASRGDKESRSTSSYNTRSTRGTALGGSRPRPIRQRPREEIERHLRRLKLEKELINEHNTKPGADYSVRYFEQDDNDRRRELVDEQAFEESYGRLDASEIGSGISDFREGLRTAEERDAFNAVLEAVGERWDSARSPEDLERMIAKLEEYTKSIDKEIREVGADLPPEALAELLGDLPDVSLVDDERPASARTSRKPHIPSIPEGPFSMSQKKKVFRLNRVIAQTWSESNKKTGLSRTSVSLIFRAYNASRLSLSQHWSFVPSDVWDYIWSAFATDESKNENRLSHITLLALDMTAAKVTLSPRQQLLSIEAFFVNGWEDKALESWKRCSATLGADSVKDDDTFQDYWELGVRMSCRAGDLAQAERAADKLLERRTSPRILLPLISACCERDKSPEGPDRAWAMYRRMRGLLGKNMHLSDYDQVIACFLVSNQVENGLYAFVDMMSNGHLDLRDQSHLPSIIANKFFFGKWLKRLIGAGNLAGAYSVVDFMERRQIEGASVQVNGLIGAWLRTGGHDDAEKADALAWRMIDARIRFVNDKYSSTATAAKKPPVTGIPRATPETFYLLAGNYMQRNLHAKLLRLWDAFRQASLKPDAAMMNPLLESHIAMGQWHDAVSLYRSLVDADLGPAVVPDAYTFSALWKTLEINRLHFVSDERLPDAARAARAMFAEMMRLRHVAFPPPPPSQQEEQSHQRQQERQVMMEPQLARKMLHTFRRLKDQAGFLIALATLRHIFRFHPSDTLVLELILHTTKLSWDTPDQRRKLLRAKQDLDFALSRAGAEGQRKSESESESGSERGDALYRYLQKKFWSEFDAGGRDRGQILDDMAEEMGVHDILNMREDLAWLMQ